MSLLGLVAFKMWSTQAHAPIISTSEYELIEQGRNAPQESITRNARHGKEK
jgi:hypothetical protein